MPMIGGNNTREISPVTSTPIIDSTDKSRSSNRRVHNQDNQDQKAQHAKHDSVFYSGKGSRKKGILRERKNVENIIRGQNNGDQTDALSSSMVRSLMRMFGNNKAGFLRKIEQKFKKLKESAKSGDFTVESEDGTDLNISQVVRMLDDRDDNSFEKFGKLLLVESVLEEEGATEAQAQLQDIINEYAENRVTVLKSSISNFIGDMEFANDTVASFAMADSMDDFAKASSMSSLLQLIGKLGIDLEGDFVSKLINIRLEQLQQSFIAQDAPFTEFIHFEWLLICLNSMLKLIKKYLLYKIARDQEEEEKRKKREMDFNLEEALDEDAKATAKQLLSNGVDKSKMKLSVDLLSKVLFCMSSLGGGSSVIDILRFIGAPLNENNLKILRRFFSRVPIGFYKNTDDKVKLVMNILQVIHREIPASDIEKLNTIISNPHSRPDVPDYA